MSTVIPLGPGPEIIPIVAFFQDSLQNILQAKTLVAFETAFDTLFATGATFVLNGSTVTRAAYKAALLQQSAAQIPPQEVSISVQQSVTDEDANIKVGSITSPGVAGIIYQADLTPITNPTEPLTVSVNNSVNFVVQNNNSLGNNRQVVEVNQVVAGI